MGGVTDADEYYHVLTLGENCSMCFVTEWYSRGYLAQQGETLVSKFGNNNRDCNDIGW